MACTEAYKEHIEYTFNAFCRVVIRYAAINAWRDRDRRRQREISFDLNYSRYLFQQCSMPYKHCVLTILLFHLISETISIQKRASSLL